MASIELNSIEDPDPFVAVYSQATLLIEAAMDNVSSFARSINPPVLTIAPWINVRAVLESAAISRWLLQSVDDPKERLVRSMQLRISGLKQQLKFSRVVGDTMEVEQVRTRLEDVLVQSGGIGLPLVYDKDGIPKDLVSRMPSSTDLIKEQLNQEAAFRLLSAVAHAHLWAVQQLSFRRIEDPQKFMVEKDIRVEAIAYLGQLALDTPRYPILDKCRLFGWDPEEISQYFDDAKLSFAQEIVAAKR